MSEPRILIYDVETTPIKAWVWQMYDADVVRMIEPSHMLCFAYKWLGEEETHVVSQRQFGRSWRRNMKDDRQLITELHKLFDEADIVVAHNGNTFDQKKARTRMAVNGLPAPSPFFQVDTLQVARKQFKFESNRLDALAQQLGFEGKIETGGFKLWEGCMAGDDESWDKMEEYNIQDIAVLEDLYLTLLNGGWIENHPNLSRISGRLEACPRCGGEGRMMKRGTAFTKTVEYQQYQCGHCNSYVRERKAGKGPRFV